MRVLLDECLPRKFKHSLPGHECETVPEAGLSGRKNGDLLSLAEQGGFEIFLTMDKGVEYEQNLRGRGIGIIILRARSNRLADLNPLASACLAQMVTIQPGIVTRVSA